MKYYIHPIYSNDSAEHADTVAEGYHFGIWRHDRPAITPHIYEYQSKHREAAEHTRSQVETAYNAIVRNNHLENILPHKEEIFSKIKI